MQQLRSGSAPHRSAAEAFRAPAPTAPAVAGRWEPPSRPQAECRANTVAAVPALLTLRKEGDPGEGSEPGARTHCVPTRGPGREGRLPGAGAGSMGTEPPSGTMRSSGGAAGDRRAAACGRLLPLGWTLSGTIRALKQITMVTDGERRPPGALLPETRTRPWVLACGPAQEPRTLRGHLKPGFHFLPPSNACPPPSSAGLGAREGEQGQGLVCGTEG